MTTKNGIIATEPLNSCSQDELNEDDDDLITFLKKKLLLKDQELKQVTDQLLALYAKLQKLQTNIQEHSLQEQQYTTTLTTQISTLKSSLESSQNEIDIKTSAIKNCSDTIEILKKEIDDIKREKSNTTNNLNLTSTSLITEDQCLTPRKTMKEVQHEWNEELVQLEAKFQLEEQAIESKRKELTEIESRLKSGNRTEFVNSPGKNLEEIDWRNLPKESVGRQMLRYKEALELEKENLKKEKDIRMQIEEELFETKLLLEAEQHKVVNIQQEKEELENVVAKLAEDIQEETLQMVSMKEVFEENTKIIKTENSAIYNSKQNEKIGKILGNPTPNAVHSTENSSTGETSYNLHSSIPGAKGQEEIVRLRETLTEERNKYQKVIADLRADLERANIDVSQLEGILERNNEEKGEDMDGLEDENTKLKERLLVLEKEFYRKSGREIDTIGDEEDEEVEGDRGRSRLEMKEVNSFGEAEEGDEERNFFPNYNGPLNSNEEENQAGVVKRLVDVFYWGVKFDQLLDGW